MKQQHVLNLDNMQKPVTTKPQQKSLESTLKTKLNQVKQNIEQVIE